MTGLALLLVLTAAFLHAVWNLAAKRAGSGVPFIFLAGLLINALYVPALAIYFLTGDRPGVSPEMLALITVSAFLKTGYAIFLQRAYRSGEFSLVYPLARGTGPLLATLAAVLFLGERPTPWGLAGGALIVASIFLLTGAEQWWRNGRTAASSAAPIPAAVRNGLITGAFIASYTVWDRYAVAGHGIPPLVFDAGTGYLMTLLLLPFAWRRRAEVATEWRRHRREALLMALLSPLGYVLVLTAMSFTPVSYIAPAREFSILIGTALGARVFKENRAPRRLWAAAGMVAGLLALSFA